MDKKAGVLMETVEWVWQLVPTILVAVFIFIVLFSYLNEDIQTGELENNIVNANFVYNCLAYQSIPGTIDETKLNQENLDACFDKKTIGYRLSLDKTALKSANDLQNLIPLCSSLKKDFKCSSFENYVLLNNKKPAILKVEVINRVS